MDNKSEARKHLKEALKDNLTKQEAEYWLNEIGS